ncbi:Delta 8 Fatty Acid Desaturase [Yamadazyma tenuis]|uniref:Delta 8-(E)-sphingolipid desaturase n=1 Tax=Candida tenuis (strain ATCC 10573 / BCRC 21748 / CBS 615 / JCM 9827 / NBRC 10315 / NRRL Y-1498 / VKM Y-70) TaxID=590646 RepID=G3B258_CANTC|nr:fatty acid/sphingolipid desaturase [Yamadazyma tenuis ATCC 10573]XP_006685860.1 uncharacterized protein CANTEDRAFT_113380 [Yamadazyma tenuis ATCC 10573]EGV65053.1 fatty acid/sphingolipid desaturase [Yamadazyma tenuis ATCC 10573]EGV65054.1 hypothetical protein CANTEDRAFT_113380 [Yamadazyma tenuis ATCC 10573]WEJ97376.1 Delta 8 Fatty Acid Desaturase [Yamadazyma tenuis]
MARDKILTSQDVVDLMARDRAVVVYRGNVLDLTNWLQRHPGGDKAVLHMVGRDATDEMIAYHGRDTVKTFMKWRIGRVEGEWENLLPPIQGAKYKSVYTKGDTKLENKLDRSDTSDVSLSSSSSISSMDEKKNTSISLTKSVKPSILTSKGEVNPKVPQNIMISKENKDHIFPLYEDETIVDPKILVEKYDNQLSQDDVLNFPNLDYTTQRRLRKRYNELHHLIIKNGFYKCNYWNYVREIVKLATLFLYSLSFYKLGYLKISALLLGITWQQGTFIAHDAGHLSITHNYEIDNIFGMLIADFFGGLSLGWWKKNHNVHHLITNDPVHDPDIQHLPFFAVSTRLFNSVYSTYYEKVLDFDAPSKFLIKFQQYLYYPILCFGRFNLYRLSWTYIIAGEGPKKGKAAWFRYFEFVGLSFFSYWYFYLMVYKNLNTNWERFSFLMISNIASFIVHVQITLSHFAMSTSDLGVSESFPMRQLRTTMDVDCPEWLDFFHGGLQFQAIHHLFPRLPRHNLRRVQPFVVDFCKDVGLKYSIYGFGEGNEIVIGKLGDIAKQWSILSDAIKKFELDEFQ